MDPVHERGSMDPVHESNPWTWSKVGVHGPLVHVLSSPVKGNEGPWEKQHVAIISELQVESLESDNELQSRLPEERLESSKGREMCYQVKSRDESLESSQDRELRTKSHESGRWYDRRWLI